MKLRTIKWRQLAATFIFAVAVIGGQFAHVDFAHATAAVATWTGTGGDTKFSTAANWQGNTLPVAGDTLLFNNGVVGSGNGYDIVTLDNDLNLVFGGLTTNGSTATAPTAVYGFSSPLKLQAGAVIDESAASSGAQSVYLNLAAIQAQGDVTIIGGNLYASGSLVPSIVGTLILQSSNVQMDDITTIGGLTVDAGSSAVNVDGTYPVTFQGGSSASLSYTGTNCSYGSCADAKTYTVDNPITLNGNTVIALDNKATVNINGPITYNGHTLTKDPSSPDALTIGGVSQANPVKNTTLTSDQTWYGVVHNETATLDAIQTVSSEVDVAAGGVLKGTGTTGYLSIAGTIAPGHSPGKMTVLYSLLLAAGSTYQAEIQNTSTYDQLVVGEGFSGGGNAVIIDPAANLDAVLYTGYAIKQGDTFTLIDNKSATPVSGTFAGLAEGAQFTKGNVTFSISYVGGDGNDVVLTALTAGTDPKAPNTAVMSFVKANPVVVMAAGVIAAATLFIASRRRA